jgi:magnesium transporter
VLSLRQLVVSAPTATLSSIMEPDVVRVATSDDQEVVARLVARYNLLALPVVDEGNRLVGIITVDDVIDVIREEATEDMLKMVGAGDDFDTSVPQAVRTRLPWLFASWVGGVGASLIIHGFEARLEQVSLLAAFIPVILGMGGNAGTQSLTVVTRGLALGRIQVNELLRVVTREGATGLLCGAIYGLLLGVVGGLMARGDQKLAAFGGPMDFGVTIGLSLGAAMLLAALVGSAVPILFQRLSIDPAVATGPFVTTAVDVLGVLFYFGVAVALLGL